MGYDLQLIFQETADLWILPWAVGSDTNSVDIFVFLRPQMPLYLKTFFRKLKAQLVKILFHFRVFQWQDVLKSVSEKIWGPREKIYDIFCFQAGKLMILHCQSV